VKQIAVWPCVWFNIGEKDFREPTMAGDDRNAGLAVGETGGVGMDREQGMTDLFVPANGKCTTPAIGKCTTLRRLNFSPSVTGRSSQTSRYYTVYGRCLRPLPT